MCVGDLLLLKSYEKSWNDGDAYASWRRYRLVRLLFSAIELNQWTNNGAVRLFGARHNTAQARRSHVTLYGRTNLFLGELQRQCDSRVLPFFFVIALSMRLLIMCSLCAKYQLCATRKFAAANDNEQRRSFRLCAAQQSRISLAMGKLSGILLYVANGPIHRLHRNGWNKEENRIKRAQHCVWPRKCDSLLCAGRGER